jgi:hypothetical protein
LLRREAVRIADFAADPELGVLVLDRGTIRASSPKK